jgi:hypothetical protein
MLPDNRYTKILFLFTIAISQVYQILFSANQESA